MLGNAFEVREAASSVGFVGETLKASRSTQSPDFGVDIAKIRNRGLRTGGKQEVADIRTASQEWRLGAASLPCILVIKEAAVAANLIRWLTSKDFE